MVWSVDISSCSSLSYRYGVTCRETVIVRPHVRLYCGVVLVGLLGVLYELHVPMFCMDRTARPGASHCTAGHTFMKFGARVLYIAQSIERAFHENPLTASHTSHKFLL